MTILSADLEKALERFTIEKGLSRDDAIFSILTEWLGANHYLREDRGDEGRELAETVQYPEFMDDASGGAGG